MKETKLAGEFFACKHGIRKGDLLSPILLFAGSDLLQSMVNYVFDESSLQAPLLVSGDDFPIVQYADDTY